MYVLPVHHITEMHFVTIYHSHSTFYSGSLKLEGESTLSDKEKQSVQDLTLAWDLPLLTHNNRSWLFEKLLIHVVSKNMSKNARHFFFFFFFSNLVGAAFLLDLCKFQWVVWNTDLSFTSEIHHLTVFELNNLSIFYSIGLL